MMRINYCEGGRMMIMTVEKFCCQVCCVCRDHAVLIC